jgi:hypothetical protein
MKKMTKPSMEKHPAHGFPMLFASFLSFSQLFSPLKPVLKNAHYFLVLLAIPKHITKKGYSQPRREAQSAGSCGPGVSYPKAHSLQLCLSQLLNI